MSETIAIISKAKNQRSLQRWHEAADAVGANIVHIDPLQASFVYSSDGVQLLIDGTPFEEDIAAVHSSVHTPAVVPFIEEWLVAQGARSPWIDLGTPLRDYTGKALYYQYLARAHVAIPKTFVVRPGTTVDTVLEYFDGALPLILKIDSENALHGGRGIFLIRSQEDLQQSLFEAKENDSHVAMVQEFVADFSGIDWRAVVVDGQVLVALKRDNSGNDFRSNIRLGGTASAVELTPVQTEVAIAAVKALGLRYGAVDLIGSPEQPLVTEVNMPFDFTTTLEPTTGVDVAGALVAALLR